MRPRPNARRALRRIADALEQPRGPARPAPAPPACCRCHSELVCPMAWGTIDDSRWWVLRRCGECDARGMIVIDNRQAAELERLLARQMNEILREADRLDAERMAAQAEAFVAALRHDLIVASDF